MTSQRDQDGGFTLLELILSTTILTIIVGSITTALLVFLGNGLETLERDDHSGGAGIVSSYLDRDIASADDVVAPGGSTCSGSANLVLLSWYEYAATASAPEPAPVGDPFRSAYTVTTDANSVPPDGSQRFKLERVHCRGTTVLSRTTLVPNLTTAGDDASAAVANSSSCASGKQLTLTLEAYADDSTDPYIFRSCTLTRLTP